MKKPITVLVTAKCYEEIKTSWLKSHDDWKVETSPLDEFGHYIKTYTCSNGDEWYEDVGPEKRTVTSDVHVAPGCTAHLRQEVELLHVYGEASSGMSLEYYELW